MIHYFTDPVLTPLGQQFAQQAFAPTVADPRNPDAALAAATARVARERALGDGLDLASPKLWLGLGAVALVGLAVAKMQKKNKSSSTSQ